MKFVIAGPEGRNDVDVKVDPALATVADLARALGAADADSPDRDAGLVVDGLWSPGDLALLEAGVHEGAEVTAGGPAPPARPASGAVEVCVVAGLNAGKRTPLGVGSHLVGRAGEASVVLAEATVSRQHCVIDVGADGSVRLTDRSRGGTYVDGRPVTEPVLLVPESVVETGAVAWVVRPPVDHDRLTGTDRFRDVNQNGVINLNRPPRYAPMGEPARLNAPKEPDKAHTAPFSIIAIIAPALMGVVMVVVLKNIAYIAFAALSPIMAVGNWWESKHRSTKAFRGDNRRYAAELEAFSEMLSTAQATERTRRRIRTPDVAEVIRRGSAPSGHLWERRLTHLDFGALSAGIGDADWAPEIVGTGGTTQPLPSEVGEKVARYGRLISIPMAVDLANGGVVGIVGDRTSALTVARSLLIQAAVHHGPADLRVAVAAIAETATAWEWAKWLPHARDHRPGPSDRRLLAGSAAEATALLEGLIATRPDPRPGERDLPGPVTLLVVDGEELLAGRASPARGVLRGDAGLSAGIVVATSSDRLPSLCTSIITVDETGAATLSEPRLGQRNQELLAAGLSDAIAGECARTLARYEDPELMLDSSILPELVPLPTILDLGVTDAETVAARWLEQGGEFHLRAPIGTATTGRFWLDFDRHGPHGLIGGTTGSGKSELLKTLVAAFAASYPPSELTFGLFDFKGGSTFVEFADMAHVVGMASDLDVSLARRALQCLRAELLFRERVFDELGAKDLAEFRDRRRRLVDGGSPAPPSLPRLVVIIDEFAAMATELAEEIGALTDLTARGRSLGVHLLLATQKPSTAVNAEIRTNTRLRISLQVEDKQDSMDVVGVPDAAAIRQKGRGFFRVGSSEIVPIQTALASGDTLGATSVAVDIARFRFGAVPRAETPKPAPPARSTAKAAEAAETAKAAATAHTSTGEEDGGRGEEANDLTKLVSAIGASFAASGQPRPRKPWPDPLPDRFELADLHPLADSLPPAPDPTTIYFALADDPAAQTRYPAGWTLSQGNLLIYGVVGSGTTTALASVAMAFASSRTADQGHLYALDFGSGGLNALAGLPHCGAVVPATDRERQIRLIRTLRAELQRRRQLSKADLAAEATIVLLIDNVEAFRAEYDDAFGLNIVDQTTRLFTEGPDAGLYVAATASRVGGIPAAINSATPQKLVMRLADLSDFGTFAINKRSLPTFLPGRGVMVAKTQVVHVGSPGADLATEVAEVAARTPAPARPPLAIGTLPTQLGVDSLPGATITNDEWRLPIALSDSDLAPAAIVLYEHEHATMAGSARSGKSTALLTLAAALRRVDPQATVIGVACRRSPLRGHPLIDKLATTTDEIPALLDTALVASGPTLVLIDDADGIDDLDGRIAQLISNGRSNVHVAIAGRADVLRTQYGHWTQTVRRSKAGLLLSPNLDLDGDLLGARLPSRLHMEMSQGRGFLVCDGGLGLVQVAMPAAVGAPAS
ncbi:MAG: FtsK/SpoIIIE domain-containing protein [Actinomycetota bacterium]|nr:FtsK/SpoIIIE domain-containing protein [Actinomycetota bacterium]